MERFIGRNMDILFEENKDGYFEGYTTNYLRVKVKTEKDLQGEILPVKIIDKEGDILIGKIEEF